MKGLSLAAFGLVLLFGLVAPCAAVVYVDCNAPGPGHDGLTWDTACLTIQEGVNLATPSGEVWVADGTYVENVVMGEGVQLYGGFLGAEPGGYETERERRDFVNNVTTIDGNESGSCVVMAVDARVDGFTVTNGAPGVYCEALGSSGFACNNLIAGNSGSGVCCTYPPDEEWNGSSPTIRDNTITRNSGAGIACNGSSPTVEGNAITGNFGAGISCGSYPGPGSGPLVTANTIADNAGAAMDCVGGEGRPTVTYNVISGNGSGIYSHRSHPTVAYNTIIGNSGDAIFCTVAGAMVSENVICGNSGSAVRCGSYGGATVTGNIITDNAGRALLANSMGGLTVIQNTIARNSGGGIALDNDSQGTVTGNVIAANSASQGGGIYSRWGALTATNNVISRNSTTGSGGGIWAGACSLSVADNIITENSASSGAGVVFAGGPYEPDLSHNDVWGNIPNDYEGCEPGEGDISADPLFVNPAAGDFHLTADSPCIDAGTNDAPGLPETDWDGEERIINGTVDMGADEYVTYYAEAPDPQPECNGPLFGGSQSGFPVWVWFSIPLTPDCVVGSGCADPKELLGFECDGRVWYFDRYLKSSQVYKPPFLRWDLAVGDSYLLYLETDVASPSYDGITPFIPWTFEFKLGRMGWTWIGMPGLTELGGDEFTSSVRVQYPSDDTGCYRTSQEDYDATPDNWISWGWAFYDTYLQAPKTFTPYAPFGNRTCYPWVGYRVWVNVGTAQSEDDPDQASLIWPRL